jgi:hypothetical protein
VGESSAIPKIKGPGNQPLPLGYRWIIANGVRGLSPWRFLESQPESEALRHEFLQEVAAPNSSLVRDVVPFARRTDCDDVAAFILDESGEVTEQVCLVQLTWKSAPEVPGWPGMALYDDVWLWVSAVVLVDAQEAQSEEALTAL